jgi:hypothetical protein
MNDIHHLRRLAGIREAQQITDPDEDDRRDTELHNREKKIKQLIVLAFRKIDLDIAEDGIFYDEANGREAIVTLDDSQIALDLLIRLKKTGLAASYVIWAAKDQHGMVALSVMFSADAGLDNAVF